MHPSQPRRPHTVVLRRAALAIMALAGASATTAQAQDVRLMPVGDSITAGIGEQSHNSYRARLHADLVKQVDFVNFVGGQRDGSMSDNDHEGHSGWKIHEIAGIATDRLKTHRPNVVTLHIGTNDLNGNYQVDTAPDRLASLIDQIFRDAPDATILAATVITAANGNTAARVQSFNQHVRQIVQTRANAGKHIVLVDMGAVTVDDLSDGLHPGSSGYEKMAVAFNAGIKTAILNDWLKKPGVVADNLVGAQSKRCLDVKGASRADGAELVIWDCTDGVNQQWTPRANGTLEVYGGKCLDVLKGATSPGAAVGIWACNGGTNQQWRLNGDGSVVNVKSGLCLDALNNRVDNGSKVSVWTCNGGLNQEWRLR